jgi:putative hydrolases of HD superfamily
LTDNQEAGSSNLLSPTLLLFMIFMNENYVIEFARTLGKLKELKRAGWTKRHIPNPESVADHSYRAAVLGMVLSDKYGLNTEKIMRMLLIHDLEEAITGDIPHPEKIKMCKEKVREMQTNAINEVLSPLPTDLKERYALIWKEMEDGKTQEANFCRDVEKLEMFIQVDEYQRQSKENRERLSAFWEEAESIKDVPRRTDSLIEIYEELVRNREK